MDTMTRDLIRQVNSLQQQVDGLIKPEISPSILERYLELPGIRGFWSAAGLGPVAELATNNALIDSIGGNHMTPTATPLLAYENLIPYHNFNGSTQYYSITDANSNNAFDIRGNEGYVSGAFQGLSLGCWVRFDNAASGNEICISKQGGAGTRAYALFRRADGTVRFQVSTDGTALVTVTSVDTVPALTWTFLAGTFEPSTELKVWIDSTSWSNVAGVPATIFNTATALTFAALGNNTLHLDGRMNKHFLTATLLSDSIMSALFERARIDYGI